MPTKTWENILFQAQMTLCEMANAGATTRNPDELLTLVDHVELIHNYENFMINALHKPLRVVQWDEDHFDDIDDEESAPE